MTCVRRLAVAAALALWPLALAAGVQSGVRVERAVYLMGTRCELVTIAPDREAGLRDLEQMVATLEATDRLLSTWRGDTPLSLLNATPVGRQRLLPQELCGVLREVAEWTTRTGGAFDPGVGPLLQAWGVRTGGAVPDAETIARARARSGLRHLRIDHACRATRLRDVVIDEGAFGKGYALDRIKEVTRAQRWLVDLGGQVMVSGAGPQEGGWAVDLADPRDRGRAVASVSLTDGSLSTSAGSERDRMVSGVRVGHIVDPRTGWPAAFNGSVIVWHERALVADILSTALYVMGLEDGRRWADAHDIAACFLVPGAGDAVQPLSTRKWARKWGQASFRLSRFFPAIH